MLETLRIKNFVLIDSAEISFKSGLNVLSGETGAGKSIIIDAIALVLGGRANTELVRTGAEEAVVEALFNISSTGWLRDRISKLGFGSPSDEFLIKRIVSRGGRHRIYVNGELATLAILQDLCEGLVDLCGQHEHQSLLKSNVQMDLLDRYGGLGEVVSDFSTAFSHLRSLQRELDVLKSAESERLRKSDFLKFQIGELREAKLDTGEDERLLAEKILLQSAETRAQIGDAARQALEEDAGVIATLHIALSKVRALAQLDEKALSVRDGLERAFVEVEEAAIGINKYLQSIEINSGRLEEVQERLSLIADFRKKYGSNVREMIATLAALENELGQMDQINERLKNVESDVVKAELMVRKSADKLSSARRKIAELLSKSVTDELKDLRMEGAKFSVEVLKKDDPLSWTIAGSDLVHFNVQTNKGDVSKPLGKIASGGELSRLMLAIRRVIADRGGIGVYLFDEIDAGIGGQTAFQVGKKLKSVSDYNQVICITHLPQIASFANHHLSVQKRVSEGKTVTEIIELKQSQRKEELARMLGGPQLTRKSLENAAELIQLAQ